MDLVTLGVWGWGRGSKIAPETAIFAIAIANFHRRPEIAAISGTSSSVAI